MRLVFLEAAVAVILLGIVAVLVKSIEANIFTIGIFRLSVAAALILLVIRWRRGWQTLTLQQYLRLLVIGLFFGVHWLFYFLSIKLATPALAALALSSYGIYSLFLGWIFRGNVPAWPDFVAVALAILGTILLLPELSLKNQATIGVLAGLLSAFLFACLPIFHQKFHDLPTDMRVFGQFFFALVFFLFFWPLSDWHLRAGDWLIMLVLALLCTALAHTLWIRVISQVSTLTSSLLYYLISVLAVVFSFFFWGESFTPAKAAGACLILTANVFGVYSQWRRGLFSTS